MLIWINQFNRPEKEAYLTGRRRRNSRPQSPRYKNAGPIHLDGTGNNRRLAPGRLVRGGK